MTAPTLVRSGNSTPNPVRVRLGSETFLSHGPLVIAWLETWLVHGRGDLLGQPFRLQRFQKDFIVRLYRIDPATGLRVVKRALLGVPKGNAKTEMVAALALAELAGPLAPNSPDIPVVAASYEQAGLLYGTAREMVENGPLRDHLICMERDIRPRSGSGRLYRVAAVGGTNDGSLPTCALFDELHEIVGKKEAVHTVITNSLSKRVGTLEISITTAGWDRESLCFRLYEYGCKVRDGEIDDPSFLFVWYEADPALDLHDPAQLEEAIRQSNPVVDVFWPMAQRVAMFHDPTKNESVCRRYFLNGWVESETAWIPAHEWRALRRDPDIEGVSPHPADGTRIVLGFDGSRTDDSTALIGAVVGPVPHLFVIKVWERPEHASDDWHVPSGDVMQTIRDACKRWDVAELSCDPYLWRGELEDLARERIKVTEFPQSGKQMPEATALFAGAVTEKALTHSGDTRLARAIANAVLTYDRGGNLRLDKRDGNEGRRKIDPAVAAVMAYSRAVYYARKLRPQVIDLASYLR